MTKQEIINELARLYALQKEGKKVKNLIRELEAELWQVCDDELDAEEIDEADSKEWQISLFN